MIADVLDHVMKLPMELPRQLVLFNFVNEDTASRNCKECRQDFPATLEYFYSAGIKNGTQYFNSRCIECAKQYRYALRNGIQKNGSLVNDFDGDMLDGVIQQSFVNVKRALTAYLRARNFHNVGAVKDVAHRRMRLRQWQQAEKHYKRLKLLSRANLSVETIER